MKRTLVGLVLATLCCVGSLVACGGDDDDDNGGTTAGSGGRAGTSGSGTGGSGTGGGTSGSGTSGSGTSGSGTSGSGTSGGDAQTPPQGAAAIEAWLAKGDYKKWAAEPEIHESRSPSPHGFNRIFSNELIAKNAAGDGNWPEGAAAVKELYAAADDDKPVGYAVYLKTKADSADGANWYWYERVPLDHPAPHDAKGVVADGFGNSGPGKDICVACHAAAGADAAHTPTVGGRDQVYTPVAK
jgi:cytochrome P460